MVRLASMMATAALLLSADVAGVMRMRLSSEPPDFPPDMSLPALPDMPQGNDPGQAAQKNTQEKTSQPARSKDARLQPESRLALVRFVVGEFVRVVEPIPAGKKGVHLKAGAPFDEKVLRIALSSAGSAINPGDKAQITSLEFKEREIIVGINGGGRGRTRLRDRIHMEIGGIPTMTTTQAETPVNTNAGASVYLDFDKPLPDITPDELK